MRTRKDGTTDKEWQVVYAEDGEDFQEYVDENNKRIPAGEPIGIENDDELRLLQGVYFSNG